MSQQKVLFALVLVAGCVALASGQNFDMNQCTQQGQQQVSQYSESVQSSLNEFVQTMSQQGQSMVDIQKIQSITQQIMKEVQNLAPSTDGFNFEKTMESWMRIVRLQSSLATIFWNAQGGLSMARAYMKLLNTLMTSNSNFAMNLTSACVPQLRHLSGSN